MNRASVVPSFLAFLALWLVPHPFRAADDYALQLVASTFDYPFSSAAQLRTLFAPQINENGQVLFGASWNETAGGQSNLYLGVPGAMRRVHGFKDPAPGLVGLEFGGPSLYTFNAEGELLFFSGTQVTDPAKTPSSRPVAGIWRGKPGVLGLVAWHYTEHAMPPQGLINFSHPGASSWYYTGLLPHRLSDNGTGYFHSHINAIVGSDDVRVLTEGLFTATTISHRLIWHKEGPAPGIGGDYVFHDIPYPTRPIVAQKNGNYVMAATVKPRGELDQTRYKLAFYEGWLDEFTPFYVEGNPLPGLPPLESFLPPLTRADDAYQLIVQGADVVDATGNTYLEVSARSRTTNPPLGIWKKLPDGLVPALRYNQDYTVGAATLRFTEPGGLPGWRIAMGNGRLAFAARYTGPGAPSPLPGLFRETATGFEMIAFTDMTVPGTNLRITGDFAQLAPLLMNERGEVLFVARYSDPNAQQVPALWLSDQERRLHRIVHAGQRITIGGVTRTVLDFYLPNLDAINTADPKLVFNNSGLLVFMVTFTDNTRAIFRAAPAGYQDPVPEGPDYWFNGRVAGNNWHATSPTNWENVAREPSPRPPGDADPDTARVFIPAQYSVLLNQRAASIGALQVDGNLSLQHQLTLNRSSEFKQTLTVSGANAGLRLNSSNVNAANTSWTTGTLTLSNATFRNQSQFTATTGNVVSAGGTSSFENRGGFEKQGAGEFAVQVPFNTPAATTPVRVASGTLALLGGGTFSAPQVHRIATGATLKLAGDFSLSRETTFEPLATGAGGTLEIGTAQQDARLVLPVNGKLAFRLGGQTTLFNRGAVQGGGTAENFGIMTWKSGLIEFGALGGSFINRGVFEIDQAPGERRLGGAFTNGTSKADNPVFDSRDIRVIQRGSVDLNGYAENWGAWDIVQPSDIRGQGVFINDGTVNIQLERPGSVTISAAFENDYEAGGSYREIGHAVFSVGSRHGPIAAGISTHESADVFFRGGVRNYFNGRLSGGKWVVDVSCSLTFPGPIKVISDKTTVELAGGRIPSLELERNEGFFLLSRAARYTTPGPFQNAKSWGLLDLAGESVLTVNGQFDAGGSVRCLEGSRIIVNGDFNQTGRFYLKGELVVTGQINLSGDLQLEGRIVQSRSSSAGESSTNFADDSVVVASAGTTTTIDGNASFAGSSTLGVGISGELAALATAVRPPPAGGIARAARGRVGMLNVTRALTLGGSLRVNLAKEFQPAGSDLFTIAQAGSLSGGFANVASGARVTTSDGRGSFQVFYGAGSAHGANNVVLTNWQPSPVGFPLLATTPSAQTISAGSALVLAVSATGAGPLTYQWRYGGTNIPGATGASFTIPSAQREDAGLYSVVVSNAMGSVTSNAAAITINPPAPSSSRLLNVSTRALIRDAAEPLIPGFVLQGEGNARLLMRAVGPTLTDLGVPGAIADPQIVVKRLAGSAYVDHALNNDWGTNPNVADIVSAGTAVGAFPLRAGGPDSAVLLDLAPGQYSLVASDRTNQPGVAIVELYNTSTAPTSARLTNISTRSYVGTGIDVMVAGFVVSHEGPRTLLVRAIGPTLGGFGVPDTLADPQLTIYGRLPDGSTGPILSNNDWGADRAAATTADVAMQVGAFVLPANSKDAALVATLPPGPYTVHVSGVGGTTGNALVEVYVVP